MKNNFGFTLIEVVIAAGILACGLVAVATVFSFAIRTNISNRQMAAGTALLYEKMEQFRAVPLTDSLWSASGSENLTVSGDRFIRRWDVDANVPRKLTVTIYAELDGMTGKRTIVARSTTIVGPEF